MKYDEIINKIGSGDILSEYNHANIITRDNNRDFMRFDCSGFVAWYIGTNGYLRALAEVKNYLRHTDLLKINRFYCRDFAAFYSSDLRYWKIHRDVLSAVPEDILVIVYNDGNGHMMIVDKVLNRTDNSIDLRIVDSTRLLHKNDTRAPNGSGIGYGEVRLSCDSNGVYYDPNNPTRVPVLVDAYIARPIK